MCSCALPSDLRRESNSLHSNRLHSSSLHTHSLTHNIQRLVTHCVWCVDGVSSAEACSEAWCQDPRLPGLSLALLHTHHSDMSTLSSHSHPDMSTLSSHSHLTLLSYLISLSSPTTTPCHTSYLSVSISVSVSVSVSVSMGWGGVGRDTVGEPQVPQRRQVAVGVHSGSSCRDLARSSSSLSHCLSPSRRRGKTRKKRRRGAGRGSGRGGGGGGGGGGV